jgi:hypothetical protein
LTAPRRGLFAKSGAVSKTKIDTNAIAERSTDHAIAAG